MHADHEIVGTISDQDGPTFTINLANARTMFLKRLKTIGLVCPRPLNVHTGRIDGSVVYGSQKDYTTTLHELNGCRMREGEPGFLPLTTTADESGQFFIVAGDGRVDENAALTSMQIVRPWSHNCCCSKFPRSVMLWRWLLAVASCSLHA
jgi:hypothetical protein